MKSVKALVSHYPTYTIVFKLVNIGSRSAKCTATVKRGYTEKEGPFVKTIDNALQSFGVRQRYFLGGGGGGGGGGAFIGNHVHIEGKVLSICI